MCKLFKRRKGKRALEIKKKEMVLGQAFHTVKAKVRDFEISEKDPFANDKLDREKYAEVLTSAAYAYQDGAVLALNGAWGTGKTTFVKMWAQHLKNNGFPVIYYNAWEDDISDEPLFALLRCLKTVNKEEDKEGNLKQVFTVGSKIIVGFGIGLIKGALGKFGDKIAEGGKGGLDVIENEISDSLDKEDETTKTMQQFKKELIEYVAFVCDNDRPLVYFIDELDRCNPTYAVKVLERIKHLFDVPNIVFVLSVDKQQLAYSINGYFGSDNINSMEYLRRFIDIDYNLPEPEPEKYCEYLYEFYNFADFTESESRKRIMKGRSIDDKRELISVAKLLVKHKYLNLRQVERIFALARIGLCEMATNSKMCADVYFFMTYLKVCETEIFNKIKELDYSLQVLLDTLGDLASEKLSKDTIFSEDYGSLVCKLLICYESELKEKFRDTDPRFDSIFEGRSEEKKLTIKLNKFEGQGFMFLLGHYYERKDLFCGTRHFVNKISILEPFQIGDII